MTVIVSDTFPLGDGSPLSVAQTGQTYTNPSNSYVNAGGSVCKRASAPTDDPVIVECGIADIDASLDVNSSGWDGIAFRWTDNNNYWFFRINQGAGRAELYKKVAGSLTLFGFLACAPAVTVRVIAKGSLVQTYINGAPALIAVDSFNQTVTKHGIYMANTTSSVDNFKVSTIAPLSDSFNRADGAIGTADSGQVYNPSALYVVSGNKAVKITTAGYQPATLESGFTGVEVSADVDISIASNTYTAGIVFHLVDANNYWLCYLDGFGNLTLATVTAGGWSNTGGSIAAGAITGTMRIVTFGDLIRTYMNGVLLHNLSGVTSFLTGTKHGFTMYNIGSESVDNLRIAPLIVEDSFGRANGPIGTAESGQAYEDVVPHYLIGSNRCSVVSDFHSAAVVECGTGDVEITGTVRVGTGASGFALRYVDSAHWLSVYLASDGHLRAFSWVSGSPTLLADVVVPGGIAVNTPYTLRVVASGPTITVYKDSIVPLTTFTSSLGQTATKHGLHIFDTTSSVDELSIVAAATSGGGDTTPPTLLSITRNSGSPTNATSVSWTVVFSEPVNGVTASNFGLVNGGLIAPSITSAVGPGPTDTWVVTANTGSGNGTLGLNLANNTGITDVASNALTTASFTGQVYTIDKTVIPPPPSSDTIATNLKTQKNLLAALHIGI